MDRRRYRGSGGPLGTSWERQAPWIAGKGLERARRERPILAESELTGQTRMGGAALVAGGRVRSHARFSRGHRERNSQGNESSRRAAEFPVGGAGGAGAHSGVRASVRGGCEARSISGGMVERGRCGCAANTLRTRVEHGWHVTRTVRRNGEQDAVRAHARRRHALVRPGTTSRGSPPVRRLCVASAPPVRRLCAASAPAP